MAYSSIGHIIKPHGLKGALVAGIDAAFADLIKEFSEVYLDFEGTKVPYPIVSISSLNNGKFKLELAGITTPEEVNRLRSQRLYQLNELLPDEQTVDLVGFTVHDNQLGKIGSVVDLIEGKAQSILVVEREGLEFMIPLVAEFVIEVDANRKSLNMNLPEGLIDL